MYRGASPVVVWFSRGFSCPFCRQYMARLELAYPKFRERNVQVLQIAPNPLLQGQPSGVGPGWEELLWRLLNPDGPQTAGVPSGPQPPAFAPHITPGTPRPPQPQTGGMTGGAMPRFGNIGQYPGAVPTSQIVPDQKLY